MRQSIADISLDLHGNDIHPDDGSGHDPGEHSKSFLHYAIKNREK